MFNFEKPQAVVPPPPMEGLHCACWCNNLWVSKLAGPWLTVKLIQCHGKSLNNPGSSHTHPPSCLVCSLLRENISSQRQVVPALVCSACFPSDLGSGVGCPSTDEGVSMALTRWCSCPGPLRMPLCPAVSASAPVFAGPFAKLWAACCSLICKPEALPAWPESSCAGALQPHPEPRSHLRKKRAIFYRDRWGTRTNAS